MKSTPMLWMRYLCLALFLSTMSCAAMAEEPAAPPSADLFEREALKLLKASFEKKRGVVVHVNGEAIAGLVKAIGPDVVVMSSREFETVIVRREKIDSIEAY